MEGPRGVAVNQKGEVVVSDNDRHCVSVFSPNGVKLRSFGSRGSRHGQFDRPQGVAVDGKGGILVADYNNHCIQKSTVEGQFLAVVGIKGTRPLQFRYPCDIALSNNKVYVTDLGNNRIQVLHSYLTFSSTFGKEGSGKGQFNSPRGIACDSTGNVYVADRDNHRIQVFTAEGKFLRIFRKRGQGKGELDTPISIEVHDRLLYVGEGGGTWSTWRGRRERIGDLACRQTCTSSHYVRLVVHNSGDTICCHTISETSSKQNKRY